MRTFHVELYDALRPAGRRKVMQGANCARIRVDGLEHDDAMGWSHSRRPIYDAAMGASKFANGERPADDDVLSFHRDGRHIIDVRYDEALASQGGSSITTELSTWAPYTRRDRKPVTHILELEARRESGWGAIFYRGLMIGETILPWSEAEAASWLWRERAAIPDDLFCWIWDGVEVYSGRIGDWCADAFRW